MVADGFLVVSGTNVHFMAFVNAMPTIRANNGYTWGDMLFK